MSTQMQLRGGTTAETLLFTGAQREVTVDTDKNTLVVQDGVTPGGFPLASEEKVADGTYLYSDDTGGGSAADAYILVPQAHTNVPNAYRNGIIFSFVTANANTGPSTANFQMLGVKNIKYPGGVDPAAGDINGRVTLIYDSANDWLELQRKALGPPPQIRTAGGSVAGNALTVTLGACTIDFRSTTGSNGAITSINVASTLSLVVPSGATLGTVNGVASSIAVVAINNAGTVELAVINVAGAGQLDESATISTTAISAASTSASTFYSAAARAGVAYRVVGVIESTQASAGVWATSPSKVQGQGGQAIIGLLAAKSQVTAWVNYDSTSGTPTARDSFNVSSLTDNAVGDATINFTTAMNNDDFSGTCGISLNVSAAPTVQLIATGYPVSTSAFRIKTTNTGGTATDLAYVGVTIVGGK